MRTGEGTAISRTISIARIELRSVSLETSLPFPKNVNGATFLLNEASVPEALLYF